jgi:hypothetical protein
MDQSLIEKIKLVTGQEDSVVAEFLEGLSLDQMYELIDAKRKGDDAAIESLVAPIMSTTDSDTEEFKEALEEKMKKDSDNKIKIDLPKPRDPMARELAKGQYQPKVTPNKKETLARQDRKHKGRVDDSFAAPGDQVLEGVMGMSAMPSIKKMLTLAGRPAEEDDIKQAMEDFMGDFSDLSGLTIQDITTPVGTTIPAGPLDEPVVDAPADAEQFTFDQETDSLVANLAGVARATGSTPAYANIRSSVESIKTQLHDIKITEFSEVKGLIGELQSMLDTLGNQVK